MAKQTKRPVGRPKRQPEPINALRLKALEGMDRTRQRQDTRNFVPLDELKDKVDGLSARKKYTGKEIEELRTSVKEMYDFYVADLNEEKAKNERELNEALRCMHIDLDIKPSGKAITEKEWNLLHDLRPDGKKRPGPKPRPKKTVWQLGPGERGNGTEPAEPVDLDAMEKAYETAMIEREIQRQKETPDFCVGKRLRKDNAKRPSPIDQSRFYY